MTHFLITLMRVVMGAASALVVYIFLKAEILKIFDLSKAPFVFFAISFVAGFSERLVLKAVESVIGKESG